MCWDALFYHIVICLATPDTHISTHNSILDEDKNDTPH